MVDNEPVDHRTPFEKVRDDVLESAEHYKFLNSIPYKSFDAEREKEKEEAFDELASRIAAGLPLIPPQNRAFILAEAIDRSASRLYGLGHTAELLTRVVLNISETVSQLSSPKTNPTK